MQVILIFETVKVIVQTKIRLCREKFSLKINKRACTSIRYTRVVDAKKLQPNRREGRPSFVQTPATFPAKISRQITVVISRVLLSDQGNKFTREFSHQNFPVK